MSYCIAIEFVTQCPDIYLDYPCLPFLKMVNILLDISSFDASIMSLSSSLLILRNWFVSYFSDQILV